MSAAAYRACSKNGCTFKARPGIRLCGWHDIARQPIAAQVNAAHRRLARTQASVGYIYRARVPAAQWPAGGRWCSGCQSVVPLWYVSGSRCSACSSEAKRSSHVERTYGIAAEVEQDLLRWQSGRCFICGRKAVTRRLAVDHDHDSGEVRGLLCSDDKFGCNVLLRRILGDPGAAARLVAYVTMSPIDRMLAGHRPWAFELPAPEGPPPPF